jgi:biotin synthase-like enzyme
MVQIEDIVIIKSKKIKIRCCFCGSSIYKHNNASHIRTEKCRNVKYIMCERFEIDGVQLSGLYWLY